MAWLLRGVDGRRWIGADWVVRNAFELMSPTLLTSAPLVARTYTAAALDSKRILDLGPLLEDERHAAAWRFAVRQALRLARAERDETWYRAELRVVFEAALEGLEALLRPDGSELIADLASTFGIEDRNIFVPPPFIRHQMC